MAQVNLEQVSREYPGGVRAIDALDLQVADGELLVLVGPSGSGKTTTLRLIAGLERATQGTVRIAGRVVNDVGRTRNRHVAMVFQHPALYPHLNVYGNLAFGLGRSGTVAGWGDCGGAWSSRRSQPRGTSSAMLPVTHVHEAAAAMDISRLLGRLPTELSGGERSAWRWPRPCCEAGRVSV